jgi:hypothetical protein
MCPPYPHPPELNANTYSQQQRPATVELATFELATFELIANVRHLLYLGALAIRAIVELMLSIIENMGSLVSVRVGPYRRAYLLLALVLS